MNAASSAMAPGNLAVVTGRASVTGLAAASSGAPMPQPGIVRDHLRSVIASEGPDFDQAGVAFAVRRSADL